MTYINSREAEFYRKYGLIDIQAGEGIEIDKSNHRNPVISSTGGSGSEGPQGPQGPQGSVGPQGPKGDTGLKGDAGAKGEKGDTGAEGPQGLAGVKGDTGTQGVKGNNGTNGAQGIQGPKGDKGEVGDAGVGLVNRGFWVSGTSYDPSDYVYATSSTRADTRSLYTLLDKVVYISTIEPSADPTHWIEMAAPKGDKGDPGAQGNPGIKGDQGVAGNTGAKGDQGIQGIRGLQGIKGDKGDQGDRGTAGLPGTAPVFTGAEAVSLPAGSTPTVETTGQPSMIFLKLGIPKGDKGDKGDVGPGVPTLANNTFLVGSAAGNAGRKIVATDLPNASDTQAGIINATLFTRLNNATNLPTANTLAKHDAEGHLNAKEPKTGENVVNKNYADRAVLKVSAAGIVLFEDLVANEVSMLVVTLPEGRFDSTPSVMLTVGSGVPQRCTVSVLHINSVSFRAYLVRDNTTTTGVNWVAIIRDNDEVLPFVNPAVSNINKYTGPTKKVKCLTVGCPEHNIEKDIVDPETSKVVCGTCSYEIV